MSLAAKRDRDIEKGRVAPAKVKRYWAGQAPAWAAAADSDEDDEGADGERTVQPPVVAAIDDARLARLQQSVDSDDEEDNATRRRRAIAEATVVKSGRSDPTAAAGPGSDGQESEEELEETDEQIAERRARQRARVAELLKQEEAQVAAQPALQSESSEYETETDEDSEDDRPAMVKPLFVPAAMRDTIAERDALIQQEAEQEEAEARRKVQRQQETRELVKQAIVAEAAAAEALETQAKADVADIDTDDEDDPDAAVEAWKLRELARLKRVRDALEAARLEEEENQRYRNMSLEEKAAYDAAHSAPAARTKAPRPKMQFMQKYYHKGAFFQHEGDDERATAGGDSIYRERDFTAPTGADKSVDKSTLPEVMQVRNFGRSGQSKYKHLAAEDTTAPRDEYYSNPHNVGKSALAKRLAAKAEFHAPRSSRT